MRRLALLVLALLAVGPAADAQLRKPPEGLPGFRLKKTAEGETWWHRKYRGYDYMVRPSSDVWDHSPLSVLSPEELASLRFGIDKLAMESRTPRLGITAIGGPEAGKVEQPDEDPGGPPSPAAVEDCGHVHEGAEALDAFCWARFWKRNGETVLWIVAAAIGLVIVVLALATRRP